MKTFFLGIIAIAMQGSFQSHAQDASPNPSTVTIVDETDTNLAADTASNSATSTEGNGLPGDLPYIPPQAPSDTDATSSDKNPSTLEAAAKLYTQGKSDEALAIVNAILNKDPKNVNALILRGAIYGQKQAWDQAENDFQAVLQMDPKNDGVRYDLADLKFKQKKFDAARLAFQPLQNYNDSDISDLIKYKIYICDLLGGNEDMANQELDAFNKVGSNASYYFGNAAWDLVHKKPEDARGWLVSASHIYSERKQSVYSSILIDTGYLPLHPSPDNK